MKEILIIGNGISGMMCAIRCAELGMKVKLIAPGPSEQSQSVMAAGGINAVAIFVFVVDKRTFVRYNQDIEQLFPWRPRICQN